MIFRGILLTSMVDGMFDHYDDDDDDEFCNDGRDCNHDRDSQGSG